MCRSWWFAAALIVVLLAIPLGSGFAQSGFPRTAAYLPIVFQALPTTTPVPPTATLSGPILSTQTPTATATASVTPTHPTGPTTTAVPPHVPIVTGVCAQNAPAPTNDGQAWMTVTNPARRSNTTLCVRLIVGGQVVSGASASGTAHYKSTDTDLGPATTDDQGIAAITFNVGGATSGYTVDVDVEVTSDGQTYVVDTSFTPE